MSNLVGSMFGPRSSTEPEAGAGAGPEGQTPSFDSIFQS